MTKNVLPSFAEVVYQVLTQKAKSTIDLRVGVHRMAFETEALETGVVKEANWKKLSPALGHPQNVLKLNNLDDGEKKRSQTVVKSGSSHYVQLEVILSIPATYPLGGIQAKRHQIRPMGDVCRA
jgi:hypothetical protein